MTTLTADQIAIIKATWAIPSAQPTDSGEAILLAFFERFPANQNYFNAFKNTPLLSLKGTPGFRTHALRVVTVIHNAVEALDKPDYLTELNEIWSKIGETHSKRKISKNAFNELRTTVCDVLTQVCQLDGDQVVAWGTFFDIIYHIIFNKMDQQAATAPSK